ncbi:MAG: (2Fe-2S)-binding protein [Spirochaetia bacterium]|nr:(2Fe-2S)-binding protein [Spirochaetia bacterium]MCF7946884.1 (2Fe-2S)-binding protein [Spirochaetia bacterium]MCF7953191.1 (2Fe-2S)-binding protein [Spirochaetales bacterium]
MSKIHFTLNGKEMEVDVHPSKRLLDVLRDTLAQTSVKEGCGEGECGACSVLKDGLLVNSCMVPMAAVEGTEITSLEGYRNTDKGKCLIEAFADTGAVQCGFCTPGMVMAAEALLSENPAPDEKEIRRGLSGNLCRCTGYDMIIKGVMLAAERGKGLW